MRLRNAAFLGGVFGEEVRIEQSTKAAVVSFAAVLYAEEEFPRTAGVFVAAALQAINNVSRWYNRVMACGTK